MTILELEPNNEKTDVESLSRLRIKSTQLFDEFNVGGQPPLYTKSLKNREEHLQILLVEDDKTIAAHTLKVLAQAGHNVNCVTDGKVGLAHCLDTDYDLMIIDRMLPSMDGLSLVKAARAAGVTTPALFISALSSSDDRLEGLSAGADDYLAKPFLFSELLTRVNALGSRPIVSGEKTSITVGDLTMDLLAQTVHRGDVSINLLPLEFLLLEVLMRYEGRLVSRTMLLEKVWGFHFDPKTSVVETHINRLRNKMDKPFDKQLLHASRNVGYSIQMQHPT